MKHPTRRELMVLATASLAAVQTSAQTPAPPNTDWYQAALDSHKQNSAILAMVQIPLAIEPAFHFQA